MAATESLMKVGIDLNRRDLRVTQSAPTPPSSDPKKVHESTADILVRCVVLLYADCVLAGSCEAPARQMVTAT